MSESDKIKTFFKRALGVVSTFKDTQWYNEVNGSQRNIIEAKDINIEKTPELPEWSDSSLNSSTMATLGFDLDGDDFASSSSSFTDLHLYNSTHGTYTDVGQRSPGMYLDESVSDSSGVVALFVRLKLDKMEGDENLDPSAIAYTKIRRNEEKTSSPSVKWRGSYLSLIDTTTQIEYSNGNDVGKYTDTLSRYIDFSTAVAIFEMNTDNSNNVILEQETEVFMLRRAAWSDVSTDGWTLIDTDNASIGYFIQGVSSNDMQLFRRVYQAGTYYFDNNSALYIFQRLYTTSIIDNAYEFSYKTQTNVGSIDVFKPYNYTLEYSDDDSNFDTVANNIGNWTFDTNSGTILFEHDPSLDDVNIDLSNGDLYFTFTKYVGLQGLENLLYYKDGKIGIGTKNPQYELDVSGSVNIAGNLDVEKDLTVGTSTLFIDSTTNYIGINKKSPTCELDVSGDVKISDSLTVIGSSSGGGLCPIGTIIMWPTNDPNTGLNTHGTWALCDGNSDTYKTSEHTGLSGLNLSTNTINAVEYWVLPNYVNKYIRGPSSSSVVTINANTLGNNTVNFEVTSNNIPFHYHKIPDHSHSITNSNHTHGVPNHTHGVASVGTHTHNMKAHTHTCNTSISHGHTPNNHNHTISDNAKANHTHTIKSHTHAVNYSHAHNYKVVAVNAISRNNSAGGDGTSNVMSSNPDPNFTHVKTGADNTYTTSDPTPSTDNANYQDQENVELGVNTTTITTAGEAFNSSNHIQLDTTAISFSSATMGITLTNASTDINWGKTAISTSEYTVNQEQTTNTTYSGSSSFGTTPSCGTTGLTLNTNSDHKGTDVTCTIEPSYHTLFFFIRVA